MRDGHISQKHSNTLPTYEKKISNNSDQWSDEEFDSSSTIKTFDNKISLRDDTDDVIPPREVTSKPANRTSSQGKSIENFVAPENSRAMKIESSNNLSVIHPGTGTLKSSMSSSEITSPVTSAKTPVGDDFFSNFGI